MQVIHPQSIKNYIKRFHRLTYSGIFALLSLCLFTLATVFPLTNAEQYTEAATGTASNTSLTLNTASGASLNLAVNDSNGTFMTSDPTSSYYSSTSSSAEFSVTTTNYTGYTLTISASDNTGTLVNSEDSDTTTNSIASIGSATGDSAVPATGISAATFNTTAYNGMWGYKPSKLNSAANTNYLPAPTQTATTLDVTSSPNPAANNYTIDLAARLQYTQNSGEYAKTFIITAIGNQIDYSINYDGTGADTGTTPEAENDSTDLTYITLSSTIPTREGYTFQGWCTTSTGTDGTDACTGTVYQPGDQYPINQTTQNIATLYAMWEKDVLVLQNLPDAQCTTTPTEVIDNRDNKSYTIQRLADGNCWLLDNLQLELDLVALDKLKGNTNATDTSLTFLKNGGGSSPYTDAAVQSTNSFGTDGNAYTAAKINKSYGSYNMNSLWTYGSGSGKQGIYYNYCAASAGNYCYIADNSSGDAAQDICPSGWYIPKSDGRSGGTYGDYINLSVSYGADPTNFKNALRTPLSGGFNNTSAYSQGNAGGFWSSSRYDGSNMYDLDVGSSSINPQHHETRKEGNSVRCVKKTDAEIDALDALKNETMQSVTNSQLATAIPNNGNFVSLPDARDGNVYTITKINGRYWMTQNLRFTGTSLSSTTSNVASTYTDASPYQINQNMSAAGAWKSLSSDSVCQGSSNSTNNTSYQCMQEGTDSNGNPTAWYNYAAASAGTTTGTSNSTNAQYDICPKGWRLPTYSEQSGVRSYTSAFSPVYGGNYVSGTLYDASTRGYWWSASANGSKYRHYLYYYSSSLITPTYGNDRSHGYYIRCIRKSDAEIIQETETMQSVTNDQLAAAMPNNGDKISLPDVRDGKTYAITKINGNYWMTQNLRYVGDTGSASNSMTIKAATTNISANKTLSYSDLTAGNDYSNARIHVGTDNTGGDTVWYNYAAASAGTITGDSNSTIATYDLCPKGWRLPTRDEQSGITSYTSAFSPVSGGNYYSGTLRNASTYGAWWSAIAYDSANRYSLSYGSGSLYTSNNGRANGFYIRCIRST